MTQYEDFPTTNRALPLFPIRVPIRSETGGSTTGRFLDGDLVVPDEASGIVLFAHGSGSSRHSRRNRFVAGVLNEAGVATLLLDLLTPDEEMAEQYTRHLRFDIALLSNRLGDAAQWLAVDPQTASLPLGLFGASTGGAAALVVAAAQPQRVQAVVSRGGRPDLAGDALARVQAPTLLIVGERDGDVILLNREAAERLRAARVVRIEIVPGAAHLFEEPGALKTVSQLAADWFRRFLVVPGSGGGQNS
jgi:pimeloyl-ACP methyl ester carboxylesterase